MPNAQLRQTYYDKVYNYRPAWIVRWGLLVILLFMLLIFIAAWFIKYPDTIIAVAEVTTENPPSHITARVNGKIMKLWINDGEFVKTGTRLAMIETTVSWDDIKILEKYINQIDKSVDEGRTIEIKSFRSDLKLGELQPHYNTLITSYNEYIKYRKYSYTKKEMSSTEKLLIAKYKFWNKQKEQREVHSDIYSLSKTDHNRDVELYSSDVISAAEMGQSKMGLLQKEATLKELDLLSANTITEIRQIEYNLEILQAKDEEEHQRVIVDVRQAISQLSSQIEFWIQNYIVTTPIDGKATFTTYWAENQNINAGDIIMSIVPPDTMQTIVRVQFPMQNAGKVFAGQRVNIKLENYPYSEFGLLQGKVSSISSVPNKDFLYSANVVLDKGLITSYNKRLDSGVYLKGSAEVLTDDYSLLLRLFNPLKAFINEKVRREEKYNNEKIHEINNNDTDN